jgi:hypothetical protein
MADLHAKHPQAKFLTILNDYYASNLSIETGRRFLQRNNIHDAVVGYATTFGSSEPGMWFPLGTVRVERVLPEDDQTWLRSRGIHYVVVEYLFLKAANETIEEWMQHQHGSLVDELAFTTDPGAPLGHLYLVHLSPTGEAAPLVK